MLIEGYGTEPVVDTAWLRGEIAKLRSQISPEASLRITPPSWKQWRIAVGLYQLDRDMKPVRDRDGNLVPSKRKTCTQRQAALLVMVALWKPLKRPLVQTVVGSELRVDQLNKLNLPRFFDDWVRANGAIEGEPLLTMIRQNGGPTLKQLSDLSEGLLGERVSVRSLARQIKTKGPVRKDDPIPNHVVVQLIRWMLARQKDRCSSWPSEISYLGLPPGN